MFVTRANAWMATSHFGIVASVTNCVYSAHVVV